MKLSVMIFLILICLNACKYYRGNCCPILGNNDIIENPRFVRDYVKNAEVYKFAYEKCSCK